MIWGTLLIGWSGVVASTTAWAALRSGPTKTAAATTIPAGRTLVLRPCAGEEPRLEEALASTAYGAGRLPLGVRIALASERDGAWVAAVRAGARLRAAGVDAAVVVTGAQGPNRKVDQLARLVAVEREPPDVIVIADSDVDLSGVSLAELLAPMHDPRVGASWAPPVEMAPTTWADHASAAVLESSLHSFRLLHALDRTVVCGKLMAIRSEALRVIGGFAPLRTQLGEDMELSRLLRRAGYAVSISRARAPSLAAGRRFRDVLSRYIRWTMVIRAQRPALLLSYPALLAATPLLLACAALLAIAREPRQAGVAIAIALGARLGGAVAARVSLGRAVKFHSLVVDAVFADLLLLAAFACALFRREVTWRGRVLQTLRGGVIRDEVSP
ncbi:MAG: glycosyltransferase [Myxococcota bacterium]|nr:glycosyltransferase [Myxococcota bacterium]